MSTFNLISRLLLVFRCLCYHFLAFVTSLLPLVGNAVSHCFLYMLGAVKSACYRCYRFFSLHIYRVLTFVGIVTFCGNMVTMYANLQQNKELIVLPLSNLSGSKVVT